MKHLDEKRSKKLLSLQETLGIKFKHSNLLNEALIHSSYAYQHRLPFSNERLEFLGDVIINLVVTEYLFKNYPSFEEGELAKIRSTIINKASIASIAKKIRMGNYLLLGKSEEKGGGREKDSILADAFEALIGAVYVDQGLRKVKKLLLHLFEEKLSSIKVEESKDPKTKLQELTVQRYKVYPRYLVTKEEGPDHSKTFEVKVFVKDKVFGEGIGRSKKEASIKAAEDALRRME